VARFPAPVGDFFGGIHTSTHHKTMKHHKAPWSTSLIIATSAVSVLLLGANTRAAVTPIGPFTGNLNETWESFNDYLTGPRYLANPASIMGGGAFISNPLMSVYLTNSDTSFGLGSSGNAQVADGVKGMGLDGFAQTATITFLNPVVDFGAYWGANTPPTPATVSLVFSDGSFESFTYSAPHDGTLNWHGWHFTTGITSISLSGDFVAVDGLQANVIPEPAATLLGAMGVGLLVLSRLRRTNQMQRTRR
jgi:hypothetical protein